MEESKMKMFSEAVVKMANTFPNNPLPDDLNNTIRDQLNRLFSVQHTPDHPPYAWMIERALRELNEKGGSTEESISNFIRKEYDDLPWSHTTLLNHHLLELCKCGNILLTRGQRYSLVDANSSLKSGKKCSRKRKRRKRDWGWHIKQSKLRNKCIRAKRLLLKKDRIHEKHNIEAEIKKDTLQLCIIRGDRDQIEDDQIEISMPERPPGFDNGTVEESSHFPLCWTENPSEDTHPMRRAPKVMASVAEGLSEHEEEQIILSTHETRETCVHKTLQHLQPMTRTSGIDSQEDPAMPSQKYSTELGSQKVLPKSELSEHATAVSESEHVILGQGVRASHIVFKYQRRRGAKEKIISCRIQKRKEEHSDSNAIASPSFSQQHRQELEFSPSNEEVKYILALPVFLEEADSKKFNKLVQHSEFELQLQTSKHRAKRRVSREEQPLQNNEQPKYSLRNRSLKAKPSEGQE